MRERHTVRAREYITRLFLPVIKHLIYIGIHGYVPYSVTLWRGQPLDTLRDLLLPERYTTKEPIRVYTMGNRDIPKEQIQADLLFRTLCWSVVLNHNQTYFGRSVVLLNRPCRHLSEVTNDEIIDFLAIVKKMESGYCKLFGATMFNWSCLMNNAYQSSTPNPQVHWHCLPRYDHSIEFSGKMYEDPNFGHRSIQDVKKLSEDEERELIQILRKQFAG